LPLKHAHTHTHTQSRSTAATMTLMRKLTATPTTMFATYDGARLAKDAQLKSLLLEATATHTNYLNFVADGLIDVEDSIGSGGSGSIPLDNMGAGQAQAQDNGSTTAVGTDDEEGSAHLTFVIVKCFIIGFIILAAILGNMLVIVSVMRHRKLR